MHLIPILYAADVLSPMSVNSHNNESKQQQKLDSIPMRTEKKHAEENNCVWGTSSSAEIIMNILNQSCA